jgi:hypothetical protein
MTTSRLLKKQYDAVVWGLKEALGSKTISLQQYVELVDLACSPKETVAKILSYGLGNTIPFIPMPIIPNTGDASLIGTVIKTDC